MALFTLADLHLATGVQKPMDIFGGRWQGYTEKIVKNWRALVSPEDTVVVGGDISWGMSLEQAREDFAFLDAFPPQDIRFSGVRFSYHYLTELMAAALAAAQNQFQHQLQRTAYQRCHRAPADQQITHHGQHRKGKFLYLGIVRHCQQCSAGSRNANQKVGQCPPVLFFHGLFHPLACFLFIIARSDRACKLPDTGV